MLDNKDSVKQKDHTIQLVLFMLLLFFAVIILIQVNTSRYLDDFEQVTETGLLTSQKMQMAAELMELARTRTRKTLQVISSEDVFEQDELMIELDEAASRYGSIRIRFREYAQTSVEKALFKHIDSIVPTILPAQRRAVELAMEQTPEALLESRGLFFQIVLPGQQDMIDSLGQVIAEEQKYFEELSQETNQALSKLNQRSNGFFLATFMLLGGISSIVILRIKRIKRQLRKSYERLEEQVEQRTLQLQKAVVEAENATRVKGDFLANMSHEIRTPMNAVLGFVDLALQEKMDAKVRRYLDTAKTSASGLLRIINDILDLSKIESGKLALEKTAFDLPRLLRGVIETLEVEARSKGIGLHLRYLSDVPKNVSGDPVRVRQVLINLLGNAIKFTHQGDVKLTIEWPEHDDARLHFSIYDTGIGMTEEQLEQVFDTFSQADASVTREYGGTGLGTTISRQIIELMGGTIWAESVPKEGTEFHFNFELPEVADTALVDDQAPKLLDSSPRPFRVLLAEDTVTNADLVILRLEAQGHEVTWVDDGEKAVATANSEDFDILLMDINMPLLDGISATQQIRQQGNHAPVVALTASVMRDEVERCMEAGFSDVVPKPIDFRKLFALMDELVPESGADQPIVQIDLQPLTEIADIDAGIDIWMTRDNYISALRKFSKSHELTANECQKLVADNNTDKLYQMAHGMKGAASNLAMHGLASQCLAIEMSAKSRKIENVKQQMAEFRVSFEQALALINRTLESGENGSV